MEVDAEGGAGKALPEVQESEMERGAKAKQESSGEARCWKRSWRISGRW